MQTQIIIHDSHRDGLPVVVGCPFPAASVTDGVREATITFASGKTNLAQCAVLTPPTPAGARWVELSFLATEGGDAQVTLRPPLPPLAAGPDLAEFGNGSVRVALQTALTQPPVALHAASIDGELSPQVIVNGQFLREPKKSKRTLNVLRNGPVRWQAELHGELESPTGDPAFKYRITIELWKGLDALRVDWMLSHEAPKRPTLRVDRATLHGKWNVGGKTARRFVQLHHTPYYRPREVTNPARVSLITDSTCGPIHVSDPAMLLDDCEYAHYLAAPTVSSSNWLALTGDHGAVFATIVDFTATRPNELDSSNDTLSHHAIPPGHATEWLQGRRREHTVLYSFADPERAKNSAEPVRQLNAVYSYGRALPAPQTLAALKCFDLDVLLPSQPGRHVRLSALMDKLCNLETPGDKWNLGDTTDDGYTTTYPPTPNYLRRRPGAPEIPVQFNPAGNQIYPIADAIFYETVWANNEYDIIHTIAVEAARTGRVDHLAMLRWTARHTIEVDFLAYNDDPWHNRGIPFHSHFHNTKGVITSHLWTQGLLQYYLLTGDRDALDIAKALGDKIIEIDHSQDARVWKFDREVGWALLSLACLVEAGYTEYRGECDEIANFLQQYDREHFSGAVNLSNGRPGRSLERQMIDNGFGYSSMSEAMDRYQKVSGRADTAAWIEKLLRQLLNETQNAIADAEIPWLGNMITLVLAIGYERTGNEKFIRTGMVLLEQFFDPTLGGVIRWRQVKPCAMAYRALPRFLGHADRLGLLDPFEYPTLLALRRESAR